MSATTLKSTATLKPDADQGSDTKAVDKVRKSLGLDGRSRWLKRVVWLVVLGSLGAGGYFAFMAMTKSEAPPTFDLATVERGDLVSSITATGALQPLRSVDIGAEISGKLDAVLVAENSSVSKGQVLVRINTERLDADLAQAKANLAMAVAGVREARATVTEMRANEKRAKALKTKGVSSTAKYENARANRARATARLASARAQGRMNTARLASVEADLAKAVIRSPIDGVVLSRKVEPGNIVVASMQAPVLLTIAEDLGNMELHLDIDEADVGVVVAGQKATFEVDAFPERKFEATLVSIWYAPLTVSGVVTYRAVLTVDNSDRLLRPGMTATATVVTDTAENVLKVPNAALRFTPEGFKAGGGDGPRMFGGKGPTPEQKAKMQKMQALMKGPKVFVLTDGKPKPLGLKVGRSDTQFTEVRSDTLKAGDAVIVGQHKPTDGAK